MLRSTQNIIVREISRCLHASHDIQSTSR